MNKRILVIDDDETILDVVKIVLQEAGFSVTTAVNSKAIVRITSQNKPDLILLDVLLSGEDGTEVCKVLKADKKTQGIPVIMLSAHSNASKVSKACGADGFLAKPFDIDDLIKNVKQMLKKNR